MCFRKNEMLVVFFIGTWFFQSCYSCNLETATRLVEQCILLWATTFFMFLYRNKLTYFRSISPENLEKNHKNTIKINELIFGIYPKKICWYSTILQKDAFLQTSMWKWGTVGAFKWNVKKLSKTKNFKLIVEISLF